MKRFILFALILTISINTFSQSEATVNNYEVGYMCNPPLPYRPSSLNILFVGNSFSIDTSTALHEIFKDMNINNVNVYVLYKGGCSMKQHYDFFTRNSAVYELWRYNYKESSRIEKSCSFRHIIETVPFDIVVFQQYSLESGLQSTYEPYLSKLIQAYKLASCASRTTFAFNMTWAYSSRHKSLAKAYGTQEEMYRQICAATKAMKAKSGIDVIIPCGTAVQNARNMKALQTENEFTRDNQHMDDYMGRYLVASTFFESIIVPTLGYRLDNNHVIFGKEGAANQVNDSNRNLLHRCARLAVANNYEVSEFINEKP